MRASQALNAGSIPVTRSIFVLRVFNMKKLFILFVAAGCLTAFQTNASSLTEVAQSAQHSVDSAASSVDTAIGNVLDIANQKKADMENKKAEIEKA